ncbi:hypothetical protein DPMN_139216 [Dreissena polymorpha]|uniref:Uncharacterized protein n=1 Tax=Dreissena polymorpha TaxID=45954 RepID=A0A9D4G5D9_DREPO|nr:hypothetical protein DPMN_139216 [Dreissena polymorpha]
MGGEAEERKGRRRRNKKEKREAGDLQGGHGCIVERGAHCRVGMVVSWRGELTLQGGHGCIVERGAHCRVGMVVSWRGELTWQGGHGCIVERGAHSAGWTWLYRGEGSSHGSRISSFSISLH